MARSPWLPLGPWTAVAVLAAAGLGVWSAERVADALGLSRRAGEGAVHGRHTGDGSPSAPVRAAVPPAIAPLTFGGAGVQTKGGDAPGGPGGASPSPLAPEVDPATAEAARLAAAEVAEGLRRLVRDLEYNRELPEPPQQTVMTAPAPWRPPAMEGAAPAPVIEAVEPSSGPASGGEPVVIRGRFLRPGQVMFGTAPATLVSASGVAIAVVAPGGPAGPVIIAVTNEDGTFAVAGQPFTYLEP
jgi:hypothetical protein